MLFFNRYGISPKTLDQTPVCSVLVHIQLMVISSRIQPSVLANPRPFQALGCIQSSIVSSPQLYPVLGNSTNGQTTNSCSRAALKILEHFTRRLERASTPAPKLEIQRMVRLPTPA